MTKLTEDKRNALVARSKRGQREKDGKTRFEKRLKSRVASNVSQFNKIDMNSLFKSGILTVNIDVKGETDNYVVTISFSGFLDKLREKLERANTTDIDVKTVIRALLDSFNSEDVYMKCTCEDFCLEENTNIKLLNGEHLPIRDIYSKFKNGEELWVYSTDENGDFKPGKITDVWVSGYTNKFIKVTLDNGKEILTTPNHRYMLRTGEYKQAQDLKINESLMPIYFNYTKNGYENYKKNSDKGVTRFFSVYKEVANDCLQKEIEDAKIRTGENIIQIHHKDFNKLNNYPSNLYPMGQLEHWHYHSQHVFESGCFDKFIQAGIEYWKTPEAKEKQAEVMRRVMKKYYSQFTKEERVDLMKSYGIFSDEWKEKVSIAQKNVWENYTEEEYKKRCEINARTNHNPETKEKQRESQKKSYREHPERVEVSKKNIQKAIEWVKGKPFTDSHKKNISIAHLNMSPEKKEEHNQKIRLSKLKKLLDFMIENKMELNEENYYKAIQLIKTVNRHWTFPPYTKCFNTFEEMISYFKLNHKVKKIEYIELENNVPVYDLTIDKYNNFLVSAGVMLHNCYRFAYWATKNKIITGEVQLIPSDITNPKDELGAGCKHLMLVLSNTSWLIKVASVIRNYIQYMERYKKNLYTKIIYPAIYGKKYEEPVQTSMFDDEDSLESDKETINASNRLAREKSRFKKDNPFRIRKQDIAKNQIGIDETEEVESEENDE